jgi:hypothetical protein
MTSPITAQEIIDTGGCIPGIRRWFAANAHRLPHGPDFRQFIREGMPYETAVALNDPYLKRAIARRGA